MTLTYQRNPNNRYKREVYCPECNMNSHRSDDNPQCYTCKRPLVRVVYDGSGKRLTGSHHSKVGEE